MILQLAEIALNSFDFSRDLMFFTSAARKIGVTRKIAKIGVTKTGVTDSIFLKSSLKSSRLLSNPHMQTHGHHLRSRDMVTGNRVLGVSCQKYKELVAPYDHALHLATGQQIDVADNVVDFIQIEMQT